MSEGTHIAEKVMALMGNALQGVTEAVMEADDFDSDAYVALLAQINKLAQMETDANVVMAAYLTLGTGAVHALKANRDTQVVLDVSDEVN